MSGSARDLATRHEKTLHVDDYSPPDRTHHQSPSTGSLGASPGPSSNDAQFLQAPRLVPEFDHQKTIPTTAQPPDDMSEARAWFTLLGLDGFDPFPMDGSLHARPLASSSSLLDEYPLAAMEPLIPNQPPAPYQTANVELTFPHDSLEIPSYATPKFQKNIHQPWPPPLPSVGPEASLVQISDDVLSSLRSSLGEEERLRPTKAALTLFLGTYFDVFNVHLPMLHAPSFDFDYQPRGLLLAMAAIGALYRLEHRTATLLYWAADRAAPVGASQIQTAPSHQSTPSTSSEPNATSGLQCVSYYQTRLLLQYFGILGGDKELAERSLAMIAELSFTLYRTLSRRLKSSSSVTEGELTWTGWLEKERTKRTLYGAWIISDFLSSAYGTAPPFTIGHDGQLELPCSEALWQAQNETEWNEARLAENVHGSISSTTIRDAFAQLVDNSHQESSNTPALKWSPFAVVCIMHILSTRFWHVRNGTLSAVAPVPGPGATPSGHSSNTNSAVPKLFLTAARRCHDFLLAYSDHIEQDHMLRGSKDARWQLANVADVLRVCYGRTVPALARLDCDTLLRGDDEEVRMAMEEHVRMPLERTAEFTLAAAVALEGLCGPLRCGSQLYRKTGALTGSLEHLVAGWDSVLLLSKWTHVVCSAGAIGIELDDGERELLQRISDVLQQGGTGLDDSSPLAACLLRFWATFYEDTWVWGVAPRMAVVFRKLANSYQSELG